jgi:diguanylate cyclase (GGDEF)-like protein
MAPSLDLSQILPLVRLALGVGDAVSARAAEDALRVFERSVEQAGDAPVSLGPFYAQLVARNVAAEHAAALCIYLGRAAEALGAELSLPMAVARRSSADRHGLLASFMEEVAILRRQARERGSGTRPLTPGPAAGGTAVDDDDARATDEGTRTHDGIALAIDPPAATPALVEVAGPRRGRVIALPDGDGPVIVGQGRSARIEVQGEGVADRHARLVREGGRYLVEAVQGDGERAPLTINGTPTPRRVLEEGDRVRIGRATVFKFVLLDEVERSLLDGLYDRGHAEIAFIDADLAAVLSRTAILHRVREEASHFRRHGRPFTLLRIDVDEMGVLNAAYGRVRGDEAIAYVASAALAELREEDALGRLEGQQLLAILREAPERVGVAVAERIRAAVRTLRLSEAGHHDVSVSIGVASARAGDLDRPQALLALTDARLATAKAAGRDCVRPAPRRTVNS